MKKLLQKIFSVAVTIALSLGLIASVSPALADSGAASYSYLLGTGPLCDLEPTACPDIAKAPNGDTVEITGTGTLSIHPKSVTGGGTFTHKNAAGNVLATGTWTATRLLTFNGYGCGFAGDPTLCGGRAQMQVHLSVGLDATLWVDCLIGSPPAGAMEGVRLSIPGVINFNKEVSGDTLFIQAP